MARALSRDAKLIVMDEPSAVLDGEEVENLFQIVADLAAAGVAVVYISHRLEEIRRIGDRITVLKDGRTVATGLDARTTPTAELIKLMTGRSIEYVFPPRSLAPPGPEVPPMLTVTGLSRRGEFDGVSFEVRPGEIVGLAGLVGAGRSEIVETIFGARRSDSGTVAVNGVSLRNGSVRAAVGAGVGLCPEERKSQGLILDQAVYQNISMATLGRFSRRRVSPGCRGAVGRDEGRGDRRSPARRSGPGGADPVRRQPAEGRAGPLAAPAVPGAAAGRTDPRRRRRRAERDLFTDQGTRRFRGRGGGGVQRGRGSPGLSDRVLVVAAGRVLHDGPAAEVDENQVLDLVMGGTAA